MNKYVVIIISKLGYKSFDRSFDVSKPNGAGKFLGYCESKIAQGCDVKIERFEDLKPVLDSDLAHNEVLKEQFRA